MTENDVSEGHVRSMASGEVGRAIAGSPRSAAISGASGRHGSSADLPHSERCDAESVWRERMGVEPTLDDAGRPATVLKTAETTGPPPLPLQPSGCLVRTQMMST